MTDVIVYEDNGSVCIITPTEGLQAKDVAMKDVPSGVSYQIMPQSALPQSRDFRDAWRLKGKEVAEDIDAARDIFRDKLREQRKPMLEALDVEVIKAVESGDERARLSAATEKQLLRDVTKHPDIDAAKTVDDLRKLAIP